MPEPAAFDSGFELLPADGPDVTPEDAIAVALEERREEAVAEPLRPFGRGWAIDFGTGQLVMHGQNPAETRGLDTLRTWIEKTLRTARFAHPIYSAEYGLEVVEMLGRPESPDLFGQYAAAVEDALLAHDRITAVRDFKFSARPEWDWVEASFTVVVDEGDDAAELDVDPVPIGAA